MPKNKEQSYVNMEYLANFVAKNCTQKYNIVKDKKKDYFTNMYDAQRAVEYARRHYNNYNPNYYNFNNLGGDCTNFISQCLHAGGIEMNYNAWYYESLNRRSPSWTGVDEFFAFATTNQGAGVKAKIIDFQDVKVGDVIQLGNNQGYFHTLLVTYVGYPKNYNTVLVAAHDRDAFDRVLNSYIFKTIRCLSIY